MNVIACQPWINEPMERVLVERALQPQVLLGMPHLTPYGLSETWLMKELGHRHWLMLGQAMGLSNADFKTAGGEEVYAAICATSLANCDFSKAKANDVLTIRSALKPDGRTRISSCHSLTVGELQIGEVEMISTFVARDRKGDNHSLIRVPLQTIFADGTETGLARMSRQLRMGHLKEHFGVDLHGQRPLRSYQFRPDPLCEFNGAGLFYFAEYQALADRAWRHWFNESPIVSARQVFFSGNIGVGEPVTVELCAQSDDFRSAYMRLRREGGECIARIFLRLQSSAAG